MIIRLILLIAFFIAIVTLIQMIKNTPKAQQKKMYWKIGLGAAAIGLILMAATGRIHWIGALIGALIPFVRNYLPLLLRYFPTIQGMLRNRSAQASPSSGNSSEVQTAVLRMILNHDTDTLSGEVISGQFAGQQLDALALPQLQSLMDYCQQQDQDSVKLLTTYLNHRFGTNWQQKDTSSTSTQTYGELNTESALAILGLKAGASREEVIQAHRRMMQKLHPDRGGSDYLAAQINQAKDLLLQKQS